MNLPPFLIIHLIHNLIPIPQSCMNRQNPILQIHPPADLNITPIAIHPEDMPKHGVLTGPIMPERPIPHPIPIRPIFIIRPYKIRIPKDRHELFVRNIIFEPPKALHRFRDALVRVLELFLPYCWICAVEGFVGGDAG